MGRKRNWGKIEQLALAVATGTTVREWALANSVPISTAYHWQALIEFKRRVRLHRKALIGRERELIAQGAALKIVPRADAAAVRLSRPA